MDVRLCWCEVGLRTSKAVGRRANWKGGEVGRQTEENDEEVVVGHAVDKSAVRCAPCAVRRALCAVRIRLPDRWWVLSSCDDTFQVTWQVVGSIILRWYLSGYLTGGGFYHLEMIPFRLPDRWWVLPSWDDIFQVTWQVVSSTILRWYLSGYLTGSEDYYSHILCYNIGSNLNRASNVNACGLDLRADVEPARNYTGLYSTHVFAQRAIDVIDNHASHQPNKVFVYLNHITITCRSHQIGAGDVWVW